LTKRVKVSHKNGYFDIIEVADDYRVEPPLAGEEWFEIDTADGGHYVIPVHLVDGVVTEPPPPKPKKSAKK
jgi:hypothetical protein